MKSHRCSEIQLLLFCCIYFRITMTIITMKYRLSPWAHHTHSARNLAVAAAAGLPAVCFSQDVSLYPVFFSWLNVWNVIAFCQYFQHSHGIIGTYFNVQLLVLNFLRKLSTSSWMNRSPHGIHSPSDCIDMVITMSTKLHILYSVPLKGFPRINK